MHFTSISQAAGWAGLQSLSSAKNLWHGLGGVSAGSQRGRGGVSAGSSPGSRRDLARDLGGVLAGSPVELALGPRILSKACRQA